MRRWRDPGAEALEAFVERARLELPPALAGRFGTDGAEDGTAIAVAYAWEHWTEVAAMANPLGYLYRVAQSGMRERRQGHLPRPEELGIPDMEPALIPALQQLPLTQRTAVWLVHGCGWSYSEAASALDVTASTLGTHVARGLQALRHALEVNTDA
jgi:DNA-directed RNA polymerase specialized sigma24 family protein